MNKLLIDFIAFNQLRKSKFPNMTTDAIASDFLASNKFVLIYSSDEEETSMYSNVKCFEQIGLLRFFEKKLFVDIASQKKEDAK